MGVAIPSLKTTVLGNNGKYCSIQKLQDRTEYGLIKTLLISSV